MCSEASYPYTATTGTCKQSSCTPVIPPGFVNSVFNVTESAEAFKEALTVNVVSTAVTVTNGFQLYASGVFDGDCSGPISHGISTVGYGVDPKAGPYWTLKNTWV